MPRARRPVGSRTSRKDRFRRWPASHRRQAIRSPVVLPFRNGTASQTQRPPLCVLCVFAVTTVTKLVRSERQRMTAQKIGPNNLRHLRDLWKVLGGALCSLCASVVFLSSQASAWDRASDLTCRKSVGRARNRREANPVGGAVAVVVRLRLAEQQ